MHSKVIFMTYCLVENRKFDKLLFAIFFCLIFAYPIHAQENHKFFFEAGLGVSQPLGKFASKGFNSLQESSGFGNALSGFALGMKIGYCPTDWAELALSLNWQKNAEDKTALKDTIVSRYPNYNHVVVSSGSWSPVTLMVGGSLKLPILPKKLFLLPGIDFGVLKTSVPGFSYSVSYLPYSISGPQPGDGEFGTISLPWSFCYQFEISLSWAVSSRVCLMIQGSYLHANPDWKHNFVPSGSGTEIAEKTIFPISTLNFIGGIRYNW